MTRDRNVSGAVAPWERPELGPWLSDPVKVVQYDGIVAYDVSRLSREYFDLAWLRKWAEQNHKKLYVIKERLHWPDNRDGTLWGVAAERAYEERQEIMERVTRELTALEEAGKLTNRPPFGYTSAGEKYDHYLTPTDDGRKYVPLIYQHCIEGWSLNKIAKWLNSEGVKRTARQGMGREPPRRHDQEPGLQGAPLQAGDRSPGRGRGTRRQGHPLPLRRRLDRGPALSLREDHPSLRGAGRRRHLEARERGAVHPRQTGPLRSREPRHARHGAVLPVL